MIPRIVCAHVSGRKTYESFNQDPLALSASLFSSAASAEWWEARTNHFIIFNEGNQAETEKFASELERFDNALRILQQMPAAEAVPDAQKVTVFRFGDTDDIGDLAGSSGVAGFYIPRAVNPVAFTPAREVTPRAFFERRPDEATNLDARSVLQHEYTHHFMLRNFSVAYPSWYVEGFAETYATIEFKPNGNFIVGKPPAYRGPALFRLQQMQMSKLLDAKAQYTSGSDFYQRYTMGWLLTHYLSFDKSRAGQLNRYLLAIGRGEDSLTAARQAFGDLGKLDRDLLKYKSGRLNGAEVVPATYTPPQVTTRALTESETKFMKQRIKLFRGVTRKDARSLAPGLIAEAAAAPRDLPLQLLAAEAAIDAKDYAASSAAADRALAIDPSSVAALVLKARAMFEPETGPATRFADARKLLVRAQRADGNDPSPLIQYYQSYRKEKVAIPEMAAIALDQAFPMAAHDTHYRMILTQQLLNEGRIPQAKQVLGPLAYSYDGRDPKKNYMGQVMDLIGENKITEAKAKLAERLAKMEGDDEEDD